MHARQRQRQRDGRRTPATGVAPSVRRRLLEPAVDRFDRQPDRPHQQRKRHDAAGQRRAGPAERKHDAEVSARNAPTSAAPAERQQQQIAGDDRRQHQRQVHQRLEQRLAPEIACAPAATRRRCRAASPPASQRRRSAATSGSPSSSVGRDIEHARSGHRADQEREAVFLEDGLGRGRAQEGQIVRGLRLRGRRRGDRIDDGRMRVWPGRCRRSSRRARPWRRSHRRCRAPPRRAPPASAPRARCRPSRISARPRSTRRAFPARPWRICRPAPTCTSPVAMRPSPASFARSKPCPIVTLSILESFGAISTSLLPSRLTRVASLMCLLADRVVHPVDVGGHEDVGRRALFDLLGQRRARGIARRRS